MTSLVSIIIPSFNTGEVISETLDSVLKQNYTQWECLIIDDHSSESSLKFIKDFITKDVRFKLHKRPESKPKGANACRNHGLEKSQGDYILFLDSDDVLTASCLEERVRFFSKQTNVDFVVADTALLINGAKQDKSVNKDPEKNSTEAYLFKFLSYDLPWTIMSVLWKKETIANISFDESLGRLQDIDFHINILKNDYTIGRLKAIDNHYRVDKNKKVDKKHIASVLDNLGAFFNKHIDFVLENESYRLSFQKFINYFLFHYMFVNYSTFKKEVNELLKNIYNSGLYNRKQLQVIKTNVFLVKTKLHKTKYIGMYTFSKYLKHKLENS